MPCDESLKKGIHCANELEDQAFAIGERDYYAFEKHIFKVNRRGCSLPGCCFGLEPFAAGAHVNASVSANEYDFKSLVQLPGSCL